MKRFLSIMIFVISTPLVYYNIISPTSNVLVTTTSDMVIRAPAQVYVESGDVGEEPLMIEPDMFDGLEDASTGEIAASEYTPEDEIDYAVTKLTVSEKSSAELDEFLLTIKTITEDQNLFISALAERNEITLVEKNELEDQVEELIAVINSRNNTNQNQLLGGWSGVFISGIIGYFISSIWLVPYRLFKHFKK